MEDAAFDSFNAPQFVDFSKRLESLDILDDSADAFFDVNNGNESKLEKRPLLKMLSSIDTYFSPIAEFDSGVINKEADLLEKPLEKSPGTSYENTPEVLHEESERYYMRKSMSVGNLVMFNEEEDRKKYEYCSGELCEKIENLDLNPTVSVNNPQPVEKKNSALRSNSCSTRTSRQALYRNGSQDHLNKLAQPKRYASVENLKQGSNGQYIPFAEAVSRFQNSTPERFRSKPNHYRQSSQPLSRTIPESPALQTKARSRPGLHIMSHEEREQIEFENMQKFKIKANPVNKKILHGPVKPMEPVEKKGPTMPQPFKLTEMPPKKVEPSPKKYEFHAQPIMRSAEKPRKLQEIQRRERTKPITPTFMKNYKPPLHKLLEGKNQTKDNHGDVSCIEQTRRSTKPMPFSFERRDRMVQEKREKLIQKIKEEERKAREFHARPVPKSIYKRCDSTRSDSGSSVASNSKALHTLSSENITTQFKARPPTVLYKEPFVPAKAEKPCTQIVPFNLNSEIRSYEREEFERERKLKEQQLEYIKKLEEEIRLRKEQEEIARIRKETEYKAKPIKKYKELIIQSSGKVTQPVSPKFLTSTVRQSTNKENVPDNSL